jgi:glycosyltransferase involved in cell wall biosynthesis
MIGIFNDSFPPIMDGVSVAVQNTAYWLYRMNEPVCVFTPKAPDYTLTEPYPVFRYSSVPLPLRKPYRLGLPEIDLNLQDKMDRISFSLVHAHCPFTSGQLALRVAREQKVPLIATFHSKYRDDFERSVGNKKVASLMAKEVIRFYEKADEVWIPQAAVEETIREYGFKGRVTVVENGNDLAGSEDITIFRQEARQTLNVDADQAILLFVGQHIWEKNTALIIESLALIKDLNYKMYFAGTGYAVNEMKQRVTDAGIENKVSFLGVIHDRSILKRYYAAADLFLFPSVYDNAPLVVREAAAMQTPSVLVRNSTAAEVVMDNQNGFLTDNSPKALADKIRELLADKDQIQSVGRCASQTIARTWEDVTAEVLDRYKHLIERIKK